MTFSLNKYQDKSINMISNKTSNTNSFTKVALSIALSLAVASTAFAEETNTQIAAKSAATELIEKLQIIGHSDKLRKEAGSATLIGEVELEKFKFTDINRILYSVPGVNIREEDGYGLRPNIGFRGVTPERSKKITVMEDGVLIGPAPYSAPAAYYFPMMSKMTSLEVFKGPAAIKYGPNTVAGALNMTTRAIPKASEGSINIAAGSDGFKKASGYYGNTNGNFGYLLELNHLQADGFKELDSADGKSKDTGFKKNDAMLKLQYDLSSDNNLQLIELKLATANEKSNETYLGLTDADFAKNPNRRYVASQNDLMDWDHQQIQLTHLFSNDNFDVTTRLYRNDFERSWNKINGFKDGATSQDLQTILAQPENYDPLYQILTGVRDTQRESEKIILGDNARKYYSQGIQSELNTTFTLFDLNHKLTAGIRFHQDQIERNHTEDAFFMRSQQLVSDGSDTLKTTTNIEETNALAVFMQDTISLNQLDLSFGLRGEYFDSLYQNKAPNQEKDWLEKSSHIWLPSISGFYTINDNLGFLFGIHEGFVPTSPQESPEIEIENSVNYELGGRYNNGNTKFELVAFYNDIKNLKEGCTFSTASRCSNSLDAEFNGGKVEVYGVELSTSHNVSLNNGWEVPLSLVYTYTSSEFKTSFTSDFPMWGEITAGDDLPYLPENQLTANIGLIANKWEINAIVRYIDEMKEASGEGVLLSGVTTSSYTIADLSASYSLEQYGKLYLKLDNLFDKQEIVSRRPYGARPSKPQQLQIGYQYSF
ncbi:TonB-dependent receptor family protein [Colwellia sp. RE-S-Sl-9]